MRIGLIDVDGHNFPNLALMKISAWHKSRGDTVEWWWSDMIHYDVVYMSKIFSDAYTNDVPEPWNADQVIKGGTGYCIETVSGKEVFRKERHKELPEEIEKMFPDYSIYPKIDYAVSMTTRGCPRGCQFCHVQPKEGCRAKKVGDVRDYWNGQKRIKVLDPNLLACRDRDELLRQYVETGAEIDFTQGLDIRLINDDIIEPLNGMKIRNVHFAWDDGSEDLSAEFLNFAEKFRRSPHGKKGSVYVLTNFNSTTEQDLYRIYKLREMNFGPYVMIYNKKAAPLVTRRLQAWCNNKVLFGSCGKFEDVKFKEGRIAREK